MANRTFLSLLETPKNDLASLNVVTNQCKSNVCLDKDSNDFIFKTPKPKEEQPGCSYKLTDTGKLETCLNTDPKQLRKSISFSTSISCSNYLNTNKTPQNQYTKSRFKSLSTGKKTDLSRILTNKLIKKSMLSSKTTIPSSSIGTTVTTNNSKRNNSLLLIALVEGRGVAFGEIGMASIDLKNPELELSQFSDSVGYSRTLSKLYIKDPVEIIFPHTMCENGIRSKLFQIVSEYMPNSSVTTIHRRYYNDTNGKECIQCLCHKDYTSVIYESREKYYALATCSALIKYVEFIQNMVFAPASLKICFTGSVKSMMLDIATVRNLELVENSKDLTDNGSLLRALNFTRTIAGNRLLRANILQPSFDIPTILSRYDCVDELIKNPDLFFSLKTQIGHFVSLNHLLSLCVQLPKQQTVKTAEKAITQVIALKHVMELIPTLRTTLGSCKSSLMLEYYSLLVDSRYDEILAMIDVVIHKEAHFEKGILQMRTQKLFAIKDGINVILDISRRSYSEQIEALRDEVKLLCDEFHFPFRVAFTNNRGFFIHMSLNNLKIKPQLPLPFIKISIFKNVLSCTTEKIKD